MYCARLSSLLGLPVILVLDAYGMAESAGAVLHGFVEYGRAGADRAEVKGVIFNRVGSARHLARLKAGVRDVAVVGHLLRDVTLEIPQRHLGLTVAEEAPLTPQMVKRLAQVAEAHFDIGSIITLAGLTSGGGRSAPPQEKEAARHGDVEMHRVSAPSRHRPAERGLRIAVARDAAFCFYYDDNLDLLRAAGFTVVSFSPLKSSA